MRATLTRRFPTYLRDELDALYEEAFLNKDFALEFLKARKFTFKGMDDPKDPELSWYVKKEGDEPPYELMVQDVEIVVDQAPPSSTRVSGVEAVRLAEYREKREKLVADKIQTAVNDFKEKADSCEQQDDKGRKTGYFPCTRTVETHMDEDGRKITATVKIEDATKSPFSDKLKADLEDVFGDADKTIEFFNEGISKSEGDRLKAISKNGCVKLREVTDARSALEVYDCALFCAEKVGDKVNEIGEVDDTEVEDSSPPPPIAKSALEAHVPGSLLAFGDDKTATVYALALTPYALQHPESQVRALVKPTRTEPWSLYAPTLLEIAGAEKKEDRPEDDDLGARWRRARSATKKRRGCSRRRWR